MPLAASQMPTANRQGAPKGGLPRVRVVAGHVGKGLSEVPRARNGSTGFVDKPKPRTVGLVGAPLCEGQSLGGVDLAPAALRDAGLERLIKGLQWDFVDHGDASVPKELPVPRAGATGDSYYDLEKVTNCRTLGPGVGSIYEKVSKAANADQFVLSIGGDHSIGSATIAGVCQARPETAVIWIDAHADCNHPGTSPSGNYHGMPLAHILGWFDKRVQGFEWCDDHLAKHGPIREDRVALIGLRDVDAGEREMLRKSGVHVFTMADVDRYGIGPVMEMALERVDPKERLPLHLSFDIDSIDPTYAPGTGTKSRGGLSYREAHYICERLAMTDRLGSMDLVEVNPALDKPVEEKMHGDNDEIVGGETVRLGLELIGSALGKTIC